MIKTTQTQKRNTFCERLLPFSLFLYCFSQYFQTYGKHFYALSIALIAVSMFVFCLFFIPKRRWSNFSSQAKVWFVFLIFMQFVLFLSALWAEPFYETIDERWYWVLTRWIVVNFYAAFVLSTFAFFVPLSKTLIRSFGFCVVLGIVVSFGICVLNHNIFFTDFHYRGNSTKAYVFSFDGELSIRSFVNIIQNFYEPALIMTLFMSWLKPLKRKLLLLSSFIFLLLAIFSAARGQVVLTCAILFVALCYKTKRRPQYKHVTAIFVLLFGTLFFYYSNLDLFKYLKQRTWEDTRSGVEVAMINDFNRHPIDWLVGRGINGKYGFENRWTGEIIKRPWMESGYLYMILRGGVFYFLSYVVLLISGFINGYYKSNSSFCKICGILCLIRLAYLYPFGLPVFSFFDVAVWVLCGFVCQPHNLKLGDDEL